MSDYYITLKVQQGLIKRAMQDLGIGTIKELAKRSGLSPTTVCKVLNFKISPRRRDSEAWRPCAGKLAKALGMDVSELFPEHLDYEIASNKVSAFADQGQLSGNLKKQLSAPEILQDEEFSTVLNETIDSLPQNVAHVVRERWLNGRTLKEVGDDLFVGPQRVRQLESRGLLILKHPNRRDGLVGICPWG